MNCLPPSLPSAEQNLLIVLLHVLPEVPVVSRIRHALHTNARNGASLSISSAFVCDTDLDREPFEASRLLMAQLVLGLQRVRSGGTMVVLLHKADAWKSVLLMHTFAAFVDDLELFKWLRRA